jgi:hypothetical protein
MGVQIPSAKAVATVGAERVATKRALVKPPIRKHRIFISFQNQGFPS